MIKTAFILHEDVISKNTWSGTPYYIYRSIKSKQRDIELLAPLKISFFNKLKRKILKIINKLEFVILNKNVINTDFPKFILKELSKQVDKYIKKNNIILVISTSIFPFVYTKQRFKLVQITDATPILLIRDYQNMSLTKRLIKLREKISVNVLEKTHLLVTASEWCKNSAISNYGVNNEMVVTIPFGANFEDDEVFYKEKSIDKNTLIEFMALPGF